VSDVERACRVSQTDRIVGCAAVRLADEHLQRAVRRTVHRRCRAAQAFSAFASGKEAFMPSWAIYYEELKDDQPGIAECVSHHFNAVSLPFPSVLGDHVSTSVQTAGKIRSGLRTAIPRAVTRYYTEFSTVFQDDVWPLDQQANLVNVVTALTNGLNAAAAGRAP
jgi:hypothetical protein